MADQLPTFFVIGAPKCGTTSLHTYLDAHPEIAMTLDKEPRLFAFESYERDIERYASEFVESGAMRGESSVVYSEYPRYDGIPARIRAEVPDARFMYVVGDPVERTVRHYHQLVGDGKESRSLAEVLADLELPYNVITCPSRYATQVRRYLEHFDASRIRVVDQQKLRDERAGTLAGIFEFLGVDPEFRSPRFDEVRNTQADRRRPKALGRLSSARLISPLRRLPFPPAVRKLLRRGMYAPIERPSLDPELRARLADSLRDEVGWLREFSGEDFASWSV